ncbi:MAG: nuclear transport factor 2 family protein [Planctomycetota bacterium]|nr:nuclear transport factor 2 family protein [Planctomycetota bacterium]
MDKELHDIAYDFFDSYCSAMKTGDIAKIMEHYVESEETTQILSNGQIIRGHEQILKEYKVFLDEVEMMDFQIPMFEIVKLDEDKVLVLLKLHGMARVKRSRVKLPYRGTGGILLKKLDSGFRMLYEHFTLID